MHMFHGIPFQPVLKKKEHLISGYTFDPCVCRRALYTEPWRRALECPSRYVAHIIRLSDSLSFALLAHKCKYIINTYTKGSIFKLTCVQLNRKFYSTMREKRNSPREFLRLYGCTIYSIHTHPVIAASAWPAFHRPGGVAVRG